VKFTLAECTSKLHVKLHVAAIMASLPFLPISDMTQLGFVQLLSQYTRLPRQAQPLSLTHPFSHVINWYTAKLASFLACKLALNVLNLVAFTWAKLHVRLRVTIQITALALSAINDVTQIEFVQLLSQYTR
jgi:hypothetical protein